MSLVNIDRIKEWKKDFPERKLVVTNGCFDILHVGHVTFLRKARALGDALLVGLNSDLSVSRLKGEDRPINNQDDRAIVLTALSCVNFVCVFEETRPSDFLKEVSPDIYAKAGDYTLETLFPAERCALNIVGSEIVFLPFVEGKSTTNILNLIK